MNILQKHEIFEIGLLEELKNAKFLDSLVFGGGTMLRLCYELNRHSADLDFWFIKKIDQKVYFAKLKKFLASRYELTDAQIKFYTLLFEIRSRDFPKRLKIEIRKEVKRCDFQEKIAFSRFASKQVILRAHTPEQTMTNKIDAATERKEIRDCFDIEFLLRKGVPLDASKEKLVKLGEVIAGFKDMDYKTTLGAILEPEMREYYIKNKFSFLLDKIVQS